nr:aminopeptidase N [Telchin licus licus]
MGSKMLLPAFLTLLIGLTAAIPSNEFRSNLEFLEYDTNLDDPAYRLLDNVQPTYFNLDLDVYLSESRFDGLVQIQVNVNEENLTQIVLHQRVVSITTVTVLDSSNQPVNLQFPDPFDTDAYYELLKINFAEPIAAGAYTLIIRYVGRINENPFDRGFYKGYYYLNDEIHYYATTQFQPYHARKAFPCFDEPQFKSRYVISITRDSTLGESFSNMAINDTQTLESGRIRETFLPTPIISAYLIAFHVSDFVATDTTSSDTSPFQIISRPGVLSQHEYAAQIGLSITEELNEYFDYNYYDMGQGHPMKNDHIALPDFPSGAMENWGMVNYREAYLLYDENHTNLINKIFIATIMAHELAHKWFGNLVTCFWWSNLWLNESYASFFEYFAAHYADPSLELDKQFIVGYVHSALAADAVASVTPMNWTGVVNNASITAHFSTTSYAKGASVLRTLEHFVGETTFRDSLRLYLKDNEYSIGTPEDMYTAFKTVVATDDTFAATYPGIDIGEVFESWVQNPGSPVLNVEVDSAEGNIIVTQERFQLTGTAPSTIWQIPVTWTHGGSPDFTNTKPTFVLTGASTTIEGDFEDNWVIFNVAQSGLYRVNYDSRNWELIATALREERETIDRLNRAQIVNDVLFFVRAGKIEIELAFNILSFLEEETDYYVWAGALSQLDWLRRRLEHLPAAHDEFTEYLLELLETVVEHVGYDEKASDSTSTILNRMQILNYACNLGHEGCISDSLEKWNDFRNNDVLVPVNSRRYVYCIGLREGNITDYNFLFEKYNSSENTADMVVMLRALACSKDQTAIAHYLDQSMYNDKIRYHDRTNAFNFALLGNKENLPTVLEFVQNFAEIRQNYGGSARLNIVFNALPTYLTDFQDISDFQTFVFSNQVALGESFETGKNVVTTSINNLVWANNIVVELYTFLRNRNSAAGITAPIVLIFVAITAHFFPLIYF